MVGFVFFDTETTGLRPGWDQIVQFAAIRTDEHLREVGRYETRCRLQPHVVPDPRALLVNGMSITGLTDGELPSHYRMICEVRRRLLSWSPAVMLGYNSIRFDEEMLRHALFQSLQPAYLTSSHGNARCDVLSLVMAASLTPGCLTVPHSDAGRPTFKLALVAHANGVRQTRAHDAMSDAEAALELCRLVRDRAPEVWHRFVRFSNKATVAQFVEEEDGFVLTEFFGNEAYHKAVVCLGPVPDNANGRFCLDLSIDPAVWAALDDQALRATVAIPRSPVRRIATNGAPALTALWEATDALLNDLHPDLIEARARRYREDPALRARIIAAYTAGWTAREHPAHPEDRLYADGFPCDDDQNRMREFHEAGRTSRCEIAGEFEDPRLREFARRLLHCEQRGSLDDQGRLAGDVALATRLLEDCGGPRTLTQALSDLDKLLSETTDDPGILAEYHGWLSARIERAQGFLRSNERHGKPSN